MALQHSVPDIIQLPELHAAWHTFSTRLHASSQTTITHPNFKQLVDKSPQHIADTGILNPFIHTAMLEPMRWFMPSVHGLVLQLLTSSHKNNLGIDKIF